MPVRWTRTATTTLARRGIGCRPMFRKHAFVATSVAILVSAAAPTAKSEDATQNLVSPLGTGTGVSFAAARTKEQLSLGIEQQFLTYWQWNLAIQAGTEDKDAAKFFTIGSGGQTGATLKIGAGSSTFAKRNPEREAACTAIIEEYVCYDNAKKLAAAVGETDDSGTCDEILARIGKVPNSSDRSQLLKAIAISLKGKELNNVAKDSLANLRHVFAMPEQGETDTGGPVMPGCTEVKQKAGGYIRAMYDTTVKPHPRAKTYYRWNLSALVSYTPIDYRPKAADGTIDFASDETWNKPLPGVVLEGTIYYGALITGLSLRAQRLVDSKLSDVCETDTSGRLSARSCEKAQIGAPAPYTLLGTTFALSVNPLVEENLGGIRPGVQFLTDFATVNGGKKADGSALFAGGSYRVTFSVPIFLAGFDAPWGVRAGIAPQYLISTSDKGKSEVQFLLFVGTSFNGLTTK